MKEKRFGIESPYTVVLNTRILCFWMLCGLLCSPHILSYGAGENSSVFLTGEVPRANESNAISLTEIFSQRVYRQIDSFYRKRVKNDHFNGCVMVAKDGKPIYSAAFGYGNLTVKDTLTTQSSFQLASVTKTFTSTAILLLAEQGLLSLDDSVQKFLH